jgi:signal transduction histidine kinase
MGMMQAVWSRASGGRWLLGLVFWTLIGLSFASQFYMSSAKAGRPVSWGQAVSSSLGDWYVWALLSLPIVQLARRFRFDAPAWGRSLAVHLGASFACSLVYVLLRALLGKLQGQIAGTPLSFGEAFDPLVVKTFHFNLLIYWVMVSVSHAFSYYRQSQERALRATELEQRLTRARLQALQMQLNPHFLFNTLNAISSLMHKDVKAADRMLTRLADLLRYALDSTEAHEVPLRKELAFLEKYLEIERTRFGARLTVETVVDPASMDVLVPNLVLQPLVENAIKHGIERKTRDGRITLTAAVDDDRLRLEVRDNGPGLQGATAAGSGIGVANTRARLQQLYGEAHTFELVSQPGGGVSVQMDLPVRREGQD